MSDFDSYFERTTGRTPYPWQRGVAAAGLPALIDVETGAGKTAGVVLAWLHRLLHHPDPDVRAATPAWLVIAMPMRSLVDQAATAIRGWREASGDADRLEVFELLGGGTVDDGWRDRSGRPTIIVGTVDMILSRALLRGYGASRWVWPVDFGLLHAGAHYVFDEVQLLGPALATSRQLEALRRQLGSAAPCSTTWMSATLDRERLRTVDAPDVPAAVVLSDEDRDRGLAVRLRATRRVGRREGSDAKPLARLVADAHRPGSRTLVVVNLVKRAQDVVRLLRRELGDRVPVDLLHSRFRPADRRAIVATALGPVDPAGPGRILVATQVVEAGVDVSSQTLVTDAAPWSSIVQRAGRCNRAGEYGDDAALLWVDPGASAPYDAADVAAAIVALKQLDGQPVTTTMLRDLAARVTESMPVTPVLRRRDLLELFDTAPDLVGNDIDVSRFIRDGDDTDVQVAWRPASPAATQRDATVTAMPFDGGPIHPDELCAVPIGDARRWLAKAELRAWTPDHLAAPRRRSWRRVAASALRPGAIIVVDAAHGGYDPRRGFDPAARGPVPVIARPAAAHDRAPIDEATADDPSTLSGGWVTLAEHLAAAEARARDLVADGRWPGLAAGARDAVVRAAALHDLGKAHDVFQASLRRAVGDDRRTLVERLAPLAKSGGDGRLRHARPYFRHELVSALIVGQHASLLLSDDLEPELIRYLVGAHHGRVRLSIRSIPDERPPADRPSARVALGVADGDVVAPLAVAGIQLDATIISLDPMTLGGPGSWTAMALELRDRADLGPFRLATLEALVRLADWQASGAATADDGRSGGARR